MSRYIDDEAKESKGKEKDDGSMDSDMEIHFPTNSDLESDGIMGADWSPNEEIGAQILMGMGSTPVDTSPIGQQQPTVQTVLPFTHDVPILPSTSSTDNPPPPVEATHHLRSDKFRIYAKRIFATWPQCQKHPQLVLNELKKLPNYDWAVVCQERHKDGNVHLHAVWACTKSQSVKRADKFDYVASYEGAECHGHYEAVNNLTKCLTYICKDGDVISDNINVQHYLDSRKKHKSTKSAAIADLVMSGKSMKDIISSDPGFCLLHMSQIRSFQSTIASTHGPERTGWKEINVNVIKDPVSTKIATYLNREIPLAVTNTRGLGSPQLFIYGPTMMGKTRLCVEIDKRVSTYWVPLLEKYFDSLDATYPVIIFDEFHGQHPLTFMNQVLDGQPMCIPQKGSQYMKRNNPVVITLSNLPPERCYPNMVLDHPDMYAAYLRRNTVIHVENRIDVFV